MRLLVLPSALLIITCAAGARPIDDTLPPSYVPTGQQMYNEYCAACHGSDAKGRGPLAAILKTPPPDLTSLSYRHLGKFPYGYVKAILEFGPGVGVGVGAHGSSDMPTWGPIFRYYDKQNERVVQQRIRNLCNFLASLQERQ